jgi:hypothetical protein
MCLRAWIPCVWVMDSMKYQMDSITFPGWSPHGIHMDPWNHNFILILSHFQRVDSNMESIWNGLKYIG